MSFYISAKLLLLLVLLIRRISLKEFEAILGGQCLSLKMIERVAVEVNQELRRGKECW